MVKQNMSTLDVSGEVACLRARILGMWVINIYDVNAKTYLLKLGTSGEGGEKVFLVMESGSRFHTTQYDRGRKDFPSNFCLKLRKHVRDRRLSNVQQLGIDRIVDFTFGHGEKSVHLILELYAQGNIVLADSNYDVLTLLRSHRDDGKGYALMPRHPYPVHAIRLSEPLTMDILKNKLAEAKEGANLKNVLNSAFPYGLPIAEHCLRQAQSTLPGDTAVHPSCLPDDQVANIFEAMKQIEEWVKSCWDTAPEGILYYKGQQKDGGGAVFEDFMPIALEQNREKNSLQFPSFDAALDEYFSRIEGQKAEAISAQAERAAVNRVEKSKTEQEKRAAELQRAAETAENQAAAVELNTDAVDAAITAVNEVIATGMDWQAVESLIKDEAEAGNPVAGIIHSLQLDKNTIAVLLDHPKSAVEEQEEHVSDVSRETKKAKKIKVHLNLGLTACGNASNLYSLKKENIRKERRTQEISKVAVEASESKAQAKMKQKQKTVVELHHLRKPMWFEKFNWFISSENYLVISGRDAQQNELVVKKYMGKNDLYVHADVHGASSTIIKNHHQGTPIPPLTMEQAGVACICRSKAWDGKVVTSAWWVFAHQVSQTAPTGEYLTTGSFMIHGKKNFLPPSSLVYGFGFMFKLDESCIDAHQGERCPKNVNSDGSDSDEESSRINKQSEGMPDLLDKAEIESDHRQPLPQTESALENFLDETTDFLVKPMPIAQTVVDCEDPSNREVKHVEVHPSIELKTAESSTRPGSKKRMSKKERNNRKQCKNEGIGAADDEKARTAEKKSDGPEKEQESSLSAASRVKATLTIPKAWRPGKSKLDEWDEEDRLLMMEFMGANGEKKTKTGKRAERKLKQAAKRSERASATLNSVHGRDLKASMQDTIAKAKEIPFTSNEEPIAILEEPDAVSHAVPEEACEKEEPEQNEQPEGIDHGLVQTLDTLTGCPKPEDILLFALPVCAPYDVMLSYKFKVKLTPGPLKKGKAAKQAMELLTHVAEALPNEVQLMKGAPDTSFMHVLLGSVTINMPGMQKIRQANKRKKKGRK